MDGNLTIWEGTTLVNSSMLGFAEDIDVDAQGNIYLARSMSDQVDIYSPGLSLIGGLSNIDFAFGVAVGPEGRIYVCSYVDYNVTVFSPDHQVLGFIGQAGAGPGEFESPTGVAVTREGYVFVTDLWNYRVQIFSPDHQLVGVLPGFSGPYELTTDDSGRLYVLDIGTDNVTIWETMDLGDHDGPLISDVYTTPFNPAMNQPVTVTATIADVSGVHNATLTYTPEGGNSTTLVMTASGGSFTAVIPGQTGNTTVSFRIWAEDGSLEYHSTTSPNYQFYVSDTTPAPQASIIPVDPGLLALAGIVLGLVGVILSFIRRK